MSDIEQDKLPYSKWIACKDQKCEWHNDPHAHTHVTPLKEYLCDFTKTMHPEEIELPIEGKLVDGKMVITAKDKTRICQGLPEFKSADIIFSFGCNVDGFLFKYKCNKCGFNAASFSLHSRKDLKSLLGFK